MPEQQPGRVRSLDGLRAFAVALVFACHIDPGWFPQGIVGVDVFFVLSGYLITSLLLKERARTGSISLSRFYTRRMLRLYPALVAVVVATFVIAEIGNHLPRSAPDSLAALFYMTDFLAQFRTPSILLFHTWSLGVEEQFYLIWPVVLIFVLRRRGSVAAVLAAAIVACLAVTALLDHFGGFLALAWLPTTQAPLLAAGALLAIVQRRESWARTLRSLAPWPVAVASLTMLVLLVHFLPEKWWVYGPMTLIVLPLVAHLVLARDPHGGLSGVFASRPLVWLGERSYGFYLIHVPVIMLLYRHVHNVGVVLLLALPLTLALTEFSWRYVESPFLRIKSRFASPDAVRSSDVAGTLGLAVGSGAPVGLANASVGISLEPSVATAAPTQPDLR